MNISADQLELALQDKLKPFALDIVDESADHAGHSGSDGSGQPRAQLLNQCYRLWMRRLSLPGV